MGTAPVIAEPADHELGLDDVPAGYQDENDGDSNADEEAMPSGTCPFQAPEPEEEGDKGVEQ